MGGGWPPPLMGPYPLKLLGGFLHLTHKQSALRPFRSKNLSVFSLFPGKILQF